ncbi:MAG: hypothetical protein Q9164_003016 [Protoblastenia rupestris]
MDCTAATKVEASQQGKVPLEIIINIAEQLGKSDITSLACSCKAYHHILFPKVRRSLHIEFGRLGDPRKSVAVRHSVNGSNSLRTTIESCAAEAWPTFGATSRIDNGHNEAIEVAAQKLGRASSELGHLEQLSMKGTLYCSPAQITAILPRQCDNGEAQLSLQDFGFHMSWELFDIPILKRIQPEGLRKLDIPVKAPEQLGELKAALSSTLKLETLILRDIPARQDFYPHLHYIGDGVRNLPHLKHFGLALTNALRPPVWDHDERFAKSEEVGHDFDLVFSLRTYGSTEEERATQLGPRAVAVTMAVPKKTLSWVPPLRLSKISLKHLDVPARAFERVFDPKLLEKLDITYCNLHENVPTQLKAAGTKLKRFTGVDFELLSPQLLDLLSVQDELEVLEFIPPTDNYHVESRPVLDSGAYKHYELSRVTQNCGANMLWSTEHNARDENGVTMYADIENPSSEFMQALQNKPHIRKLTIPADMLEITPSFMAAIGNQLPGLEELEWAFDYSSKAHCFAFSRMTRALPYLKKVTFFSLSRPWDLQQFRAEDMHTGWIRFKRYADRLNPALKHVRYRHYSFQAHAGEWNDKTVYYRRDVPVKRYSPLSGKPYKEYWMEIPRDEQTEVFEEGRTARFEEEHARSRRERRAYRCRKGLN